MYVEGALNNTSMFKISLRSIGNAEDTTQISQVCLQRTYFVFLTSNFYYEHRASY